MESLLYLFAKLLSSVFVLSLLCFIVSSLFKKKTKSRRIFKILSEILFIITGLLFAIAILLFIILYSFIGLRYGLALILPHSELADYLSLMMVLIVIAYIPDKIVLLISPFLEKYAVETDPDYLKVADSNIFTVFIYSFIRFIRFKVWIYLLSFVLVFIAYIERYGNFMIFNDLYWIEMRAVVESAVISFIVLDSLIGLITKEWIKIKEDSDNIFDIFLFCKNKSI